MLPGYQSFSLLLRPSSSLPLYVGPALQVQGLTHACYLPLFYPAQVWSQTQTSFPSQVCLSPSCCLLWQLHNASQAPNSASRNITCVARDPPEDASQARQSSALHPLPLQHGDVFVLHVVWDNQIHQVSLMKCRDLREPQLLQQHLLEPLLGKRSDSDDQAEQAEHPGEPHIHPPLSVKSCLPSRDEGGTSLSRDVVAGCLSGMLRFYSQPRPTGTTNSTSGDEGENLKGSLPHQ